MSSTTQHIAVIGAGLAGLTTARRLAAEAEVTVFEKARGVGGRMSTRRAAPWAFDHGAQYFTARSAAFVEQVTAWEAAGLVRRWPDRIVDLQDGVATPRPHARPRFVAAPGMNAICKHLVTGLRLVTRTRIARLAQHGTAWRLEADDGVSHGPFDAVVVSAPPAQAADLLGPAPELSHAAASVTMAPCWAVMVTFDALLPIDFDAAAVHANPLAWMARAQAKPERPSGDGDAWLLHATAAWSREHVDAEASDVVRMLLAAFEAATATSMPAPAGVQSHRWLYAQTEAPLGRPCLWDAELRLGVCGDWLLGNRVEAAYASGAALAEELLSAIRPA